jgi:hypothetical protein
LTLLSDTKFALASEFSLECCPIGLRGDFGDVGGEPLIGKRFVRGGMAARFLGWTCAVNGVYIKNEQTKNLIEKRRRLN